jgi:hypothetical protein
MKVEIAPPPGQAAPPTAAPNAKGDHKKRSTGQPVGK